MIFLSIMDALCETNTTKEISHRMPGPRRSRRNRTPARNGRAREGIVTRVDSRMCHVEGADGDVVKCRVRGTLFRDAGRFSRPVAVGDHVRYEEQREPPAVVVEVLPRKNHLSRPLPGRRRQQIIAANLDQAILVQSCHDPSFNPRLLDRMLVGCGHGEFDAVIVVNKIDVADPPDLVEEVYRDLGYPIVLASAASGAGIDDLRRLLSDKISVFAGLSGVGKSSLLNAVRPGLSLATAEVSDATGKGRHTTTHASLLHLGSGGFVVDTPGIREFGFSDIETYAVSHHFPDFVPHLPGCRFSTCTHDHEVDCAIKDAVDEGTIHEHRYDSYLRIIGSVEEDELTN